MTTYIAILMIPWSLYYLFGVILHCRLWFANHKQAQAMKAFGMAIKDTLLDMQAEEMAKKAAKTGPNGKN